MNLKAKILVALLLFLGTNSFAQGEMGIRFFTGIQNQSTASKYLIANANQLHYKIDLESISNSQSVGLFSQFNVGFLYFQPEFLYTKYDITYNVVDYYMENLVVNSYTETIQQFDLPINAGIRYKNFRIGGGPILHFIQEINSEIKGLDDLTIKYKNISAGFQGSVGYDWSVFHLDLRYQTDFNSVSDHLYFNKTRVNHKATPSSIQIGIALALGKK